MTQMYQLRTDSEAIKRQIRVEQVGGGWFLRVWLPADTNTVASVLCQGDISQTPPLNPPPDTMNPT